MAADPVEVVAAALEVVADQIKSIIKNPEILSPGFLLLKFDCCFLKIQLLLVFVHNYLNYIIYCLG